MEDKHNTGQTQYLDASGRELTEEEYVAMQQGTTGTNGDRSDGAVTEKGGKKK
jgi:hypothetical protein